MTQILETLWTIVKVIAGSVLFLAMVGAILLMLLVIREAGWCIRAQNQKKLEQQEEEKK